jgi:hypothetical protein
MDAPTSDIVDSGLDVILAGWCRRFDIDRVHSDCSRGVLFTVIGLGHSWVRRSHVLICARFTTVFSVSETDYLAPDGPVNEPVGNEDDPEEDERHRPA